MAEITIESLAKRVEALELALKRNGNGRTKDWRRVVGMFHDSEFMKEVDEHCQRGREIERAQAHTFEFLG